MKFKSTRSDEEVSFDLAINRGLAQNGGLYVPSSWPDLSFMISKKFDDYQSFAQDFLPLFLYDSQLEQVAGNIINKAFNFPLVQKKLTQDLSVLELFHGPTLSFKDFGARFLAQCLAVTSKKSFVLVATSGDTGSAVASSFNGVEGINAVIMYPKGKISQRQQAQITCWGNNILAIEVDGVFDDCQSLVKQAFADDWFSQNLNLSTANSINIGRLVAQISYYAFTAVKYYQEHNQAINFIVPAGNLGNVTACFYAKQMGIPIGKVNISCNANRALVDYLASGKYFARDTIVTLANAMDVGSPSNFERLQNLFGTYDKFNTSTNLLV